MPEEPRFLLDSMLGKLARWLVLMGYDASFAGTAPRSDLELLEAARAEGRLFVTRDARLPPVREPRVIVLSEPGFEEQLKRVAREAGLRADPRRLFTRCTYCNRPLEGLSREEALPLVPPLVRGLKTDFRRCPGCRRLYWSGTHTERALARLRRLGLCGEGDGGGA